MSALVLAVSGCERATPPQPAAKAQRPNIILITIESLRADHVGCYGYQRATTPNTDALASTATLCENAVSVTSWTLTSHASLFTGLYPSAHRVILPQDRLGDAYTTLAEALSGGGYQCAGVISGPYLRKTFNLSQGFEYYDDSAAAATDKDAHKDITNPRLTANLERFLRAQRDPRRPFFLFAYYWDPHYDYIPPVPYDTMFVPAGAERIDEIQFNPVTERGRDVSEAQLAYLVAQYDGEVRCTDEHLGRLWALLRELDLWDNTAIILTADHGEEFFEHGWLGHKYDIYAESVRVPLLIKQPGQRAPARETRPVSLIDLYPTVLEIAGCRPTAVHSGHSLLRPAPPEERALFFELTTTWNFTNRQTGVKTHDSDRWIGVQRGRHKFVQVLGTRFWQVFDVVEDPREVRNLGGSALSMVLDLEQRVRRYQEAMAALAKSWERGPQAVLSPDEEARLRALGYLSEADVTGGAGAAPPAASTSPATPAAPAHPGD